MYTYNAKLIRVVDGDTIKAMIDLGFHTWVDRTIRFYGINAYESRTRDLEIKEKGLAAKQYVIDALAVADGIFTLQSHGIGKYGRCLGTIYIDKLNLNNSLILEGHAVQYIP